MGVVVDHVSPGVKEVAVFEGLAARSWDEVSFEIGPPSTDWSVLPSGSPDLDALVAHGTSVEVSFVATKNGITKKVDWTFDSATRFESCQGELNGQAREGAIVTAGGTDEVELTIHGDHLFYDDLASPTAVLRFDALAAADADADDLVTLAELDSVDLVDVADGTYGTGSVSDVNTLGDFVRHLARSLAHFRGEGECVAGDVVFKVGAFGDWF